jgi:hypothetical protein
MSISQKQREYKHTEETKEINRQAHLGKPTWNKGLKATAEACKNQSLGHIGVEPWTKPVIQFDVNMNFIREWESATMVERTLHICHPNITRALKGRRMTAGGFIWKYKATA